MDLKHGWPITWHFQAIPGFARLVLDRSGARIVKAINPPETPNPFPGVLTVARFFVEDAVSNALVRLGAAGAGPWFDFVAGHVAKRPWLGDLDRPTIEGPNEPNPQHDLSMRQATRDFTLELARRFDYEGWRLVAFNFSVGTPEPEHMKIFAPALVELAKKDHWWGLHGYGLPAVLSDAEWYTLRYRKFLAELARLGASPLPRIFMGELGTDGLIANIKSGWKTWAGGRDADLNIEQRRRIYFEELVAANRELQKDGVVAACVFTSGPQGWEDYDVDWQLSEMIANYRATTPVPGEQPPGPVEPPVEPPENGGEMKVKYYLNGDRENTVNQETFEAVFGPVVIVGGGTGNDDFPNLSLVQVSKLWGTVKDAPDTCRVEFRIDGKPPTDGRQYYLGWWWPDGLEYHKFRLEGGAYVADGTMGSGAYYWPDRGEHGPHLVWVSADLSDTPGAKVLHSEQVYVGMVAATNHLHFDVLLEAFSEGEPPPPPEEPPPYPLHDLRGELPWHPTKRWEKRAGFDTMVVHHTGGEIGAGQTTRAYIYAINKYHIETKDNARVPYHYIIGELGVIWKLNEHEDITFHSGNEDMNKRSVGVCFVGDMTKRDPTEAQLYALRWLRGQFNVPAIGHKEVIATACPGDWWPGWKAWVNGEQPVEERLLTTTVVGNGEILLTPPGPHYPHGTGVTLEAVPATGWTFAGWLMDLAGFLNPTTLVMDGDKTVKALFAEDTGGNEDVLRLAAEVRALLAEADVKMAQLEALL